MALCCNHGIQNHFIIPTNTHMLKLILTVNLLAVLVSSAVQVLSTPKSPPLWDAAFFAPFHETFYETADSSKLISSNAGVWLYDSMHDRAKFIHGKGQTNNFCMCSNYNLSDSCELLFIPNGYLWAIFPDTKQCCHLCDAAYGCSALKRDWLVHSGTEYVGTREIGSTTCDVWCEHGAVADDCWAETSEDNVPCAYIEYFSGEVNITHTIQFDRTSYRKIDSFEVNDPAFDLPEYCTEPCHFQFPNCPGG